MPLAAPIGTESVPLSEAETKTYEGVSALEEVELKRKKLAKDLQAREIYIGVYK